jgi:hypothetical protein
MQNTTERKDVYRRITEQIVEQLEKGVRHEDQLCRPHAHHIFACSKSALRVNIDDMSNGYNDWIAEVNSALRSINMSMNDWQPRWPFDFEAEYKAGTKSDDAAMKANRFWWFEQNKSLKQNCRLTPNCWLPSGHQGACQPVTQPPYRPGDYVKVEFPDETTGIGEWMWVRVTDCDDDKQLVFGKLDNEPLNDYNDRVGIGSSLAIRYSQIRDHKKSTEFTKQ